MLDNAYTALWLNVGGGQDGNFDPIPTTNVEQAYVYCNLKEVRRDWKWDVDGEHVQAKYSVYVKTSKIDSIDITAVTHLSVKGLDGVVLGKFRVLSASKKKMFPYYTFIIA